MKNTSILLLLLLLFTLQACQSENRQRLTINCENSPSSLNPHLGVDLNCRNIQVSLYDGLFRIHPDGKPYPSIAKTIDVSLDKTKYTFKLKQTKWSNGTPLTAFDFERSWKSAISPDSNCLRSDLFYPIKNARKAKMGLVTLDEVGIIALDADTLLITLEHPTSYFLDLVATSIFAPIYQNPLKGEIHVSNGPFYVSHWKKEKLLSLRKNPHYWDAPTVTLDGIDLSFVKDQNTALLLFENKEIDWIGNPFTVLPSDAIAPLRKTQKLETTSIASIYLFSCNVETFPLNNVNVRKALAIALDREEIITHVLLEEKPTCWFIPECMKLQQNNDSFPDGDPQTARTYFEQGLRELDITLNQFPRITLTFPDVGGQKKLAIAAQQMWSQVLGIDVRLEILEWNVFFSNFVSHQYQIAGCPWYSVYNDPVYFLDFLKDKKNRYNTTGWENPYYQALLDKANHEINENQRTKFLSKAERLLLEEMPIIPIYAETYKYLKDPRLQGVYVSQLGYVDFKWASLIDLES